MARSAHRSTAAPGAVESTPVEVTVRGEVPEEAAAYAVRKVESVLEATRARALYAHVVVVVSENPAQDQPVRVEVGLDVDGVPVRAVVSGHDAFEAADLMKDRLRRRLVRLRDRERTRHRWTGEASEHEWRHGDQPRRPEPHFPRPVEERTVVRRKTFALVPLTAEEAAYEMDVLDHDFYLYTDRETGRDAVIVRSGVRDGVDLEPLNLEPPTLSEAAARERLDAGGEPFVFYLDPETGRGRVMYWRYDGHYGLISAE
ncbi:sigma 54 modulation/S30EA ribosomal C-terminal domain-containing protein [Actinopolymorpha singaporensis]|uniref:Ribosomal subunit interface protein n=1 Tax=Actinopolymorpha singaporensis TaxID=117157 RepID=A0A1H1M278_9ACTN|nr:sigma 54 modulation/S30EA ribosomal C-terminal domain-containing protein [Actinopolymorpha singaporensis]SDR80856.1 ribosomal subunit interface protein [Actinopolymorpha singaporensis]